jgi:hypothetical protein
MSARGVTTKPSHRQGFFNLSPFLQELGKTLIWVVIDKLTKFAHFVALAYPYTAKSVTEAFVQEIFKLHDMPKSIISDRDPVFMSKFWEEFFKLQDT